MKCANYPRRANLKSLKLIWIKWTANVAVDRHSHIFCNHASVSSLKKNDRVRCDVFVLHPSITSTMEYLWRFINTIRKTLTANAISNAEGQFNCQSWKWYPTTSFYWLINYMGRFDLAQLTCYLRKHQRRRRPFSTKNECERRYQYEQMQLYSHCNLFVIFKQNFWNRFGFPTNQVYFSEQIVSIVKWKKATITTTNKRIHDERRQW